MGYNSHHVSSTGRCFSTEDYNEWVNKHYHNTDDEDEEKTYPKGLYIPYCDECGKKELTNNICSEHLSRRHLVSCNFCQNNFRTLSSKEVRY